MGSFLDLITGTGPNDPNKGGQGPDAVWNGWQWVPFHIVSPRDAAGTTEDRRGTPRVRQRTNTDATNPYGMPSNLTSDGTTRQSPESFARANYGYLAGFINHPEIGPILKRAGAEGWDEARLYGAVSATNWWRTTSAAQRTWWQLQNEDPAEAARKVQQTAATIRDRAKSLGLNVNVASLAATATANGWTDTQTVDAILEQVNWATLEAGDLTALRDDVKAIGADYLVGVSDQTAQNYAARIAAGEMSINGVRSAMQQQAKARFGYLADQIDAGMTVKDYFRPIQNVIASELGLAQEEVDLSDSKWLKMVEKKDDNGKVRAATLDEAMLTARRDPRFTNTAKAKEMSTNMAGMITDIFGRR